MSLRTMNDNLAKFIKNKKAQEFLKSLMSRGQEGKKYMVENIDEEVTLNLILVISTCTPQIFFQASHSLFLHIVLSQNFVLNTNFVRLCYKYCIYYFRLSMECP